MNAKLSHFSELSNFLSEKSSVCNDFLSLLDRFRLSQSLRQLGMEKEKGASSLELLKYLLIFRLFGQTIHQCLHHQFAPFIDGGKNQFHRFLSRPKMDWRRLLCRTVQSFFRIVTDESTDPEQEKFFILDDTTLEKSGICMEGISRVFDHVKQKSVLGYKLLLLAITDTKSTLPLDFSLHAEAGRKNNFGLTKKQLKERFTRKRDEADCMKRRAEELLKDKPKVAMEMLRRGRESWFHSQVSPYGQMVLRQRLSKGGQTPEGRRHTCHHTPQEERHPLPGGWQAHPCHTPYTEAGAQGTHHMQAIQKPLCQGEGKLWRHACPAVHYPIWKKHPIRGYRND